MKRILGVAASGLLWLGACGSDGESSDSAPHGGSGGNESGAAGEVGSSADAGDGGGTVTTLGGSGGVAGEFGGAPGEVAGAGMGGAGGASEVPGDVRGYIRTFLGSPLPDVVVIIGETSVVTDAEGAFTIPNVGVSYDLTVVDNEHKMVEVVEGLTTRAPVVGIWQLRLPNRVGGVAGKLSGGGGIPLPVGQAGLVSFHAEKARFAQAELAAASASFSLGQIKWEGALSCLGSLTGITWKTGPTGPTEYTGFLERPVALEDGKVIGNISGTVAASNLALVAPAEHTVTGTLAVSGAPSKVWSYLNVGRDTVPLNLTAGPISVVVPEVELATAVAVTAEFPTGTSGKTVPTAAGKTVAISVPLPPQLILPVADAVGVTLATDFSWTKPPEGTFSAVVFSVGSWSVLRVTSRNKVKLPDLSAAGVAYAAEGLPATWHLEQYSPAASPEEALQLLDGTSPAYASSVTTFGIAEREFQLAD